VGPEPRNLPAIGRTEEPGHLTFSADSRWVAAVAGNAQLQIWETKDGSVVRRLHVPGESLYGGSIAFAPDGKRLYAQTWNGKQYQARVWNTATWEMERAIPISGSFILSPDGKLLACHDRVYDLARDELLHNAESHSQQLNKIVTIDKDRVATASHDGTARVWENATGKQLLSFSNDKRGASGLAASPDGTRLLSSGVDDTIRLWELPSGIKIFELPGHGELSPSAVAFRADGQRFYSFGRDFYLREYDTRTGKALEEFAVRTPGLVLPSDDHGNDMKIADINFSRPNFAPGGDWLALGSGKQYHVVDCKTGKPVKSFDCSPGINRDLLFSPAGELLLACAFDFSAAKKHHSTLWNVRDGSVVARVESEKDAFGPACFASDGQRFAVAVYNKEQGHQVRIYNRQGELVSSVLNIPAQVSALAFTHDGSGIITGLTDASILVWGPAAFVPAKAEEKQP